MTKVEISRAIGAAARVLHRPVAALVPLATPLAAAALAVAPSGPAGAQAGPVPAWLNLPASDAADTPNEAENLSVFVTTTDAAGRSPGDPGFAGASRGGECRVFLADARPVGNLQLYEGAFAHLDGVVRAAGGVQALMRTPARIPAAHIWGDANAPWRCVAGTIYTVQAAGYPTVGFAFTGAAAGGTPQVAHVAHVGLALPIAAAPPAVNRIVLTAQDKILWNGHEIAPAALGTMLEQAANLVPQPGLEFAPEADVGYGFSATVLGLISDSGVAGVHFIDSEKYRVFGSASPAAGIAAVMSARCRRGTGPLHQSGSAFGSASRPPPGPPPPFTGEVSGAGGG